MTPNPYTAAQDFADDPNGGIDDDFTVDELAEMSDSEFQQELVADLRYATFRTSPFMSKRLIDRTEETLLATLARSNEVISRQAQDPDCTAERFQSSLRFRSTLLFALFVTGRRADKIAVGSRSYRYPVAAWRTLVLELVKAVEGGEHDGLLDSLTTPTRREGGDGATMRLRDWLEIQRVADDATRPTKEVAA